MNLPWVTGAQWRRQAGTQASARRYQQGVGVSARDHSLARTLGGIGIGPGTDQDPEQTIVPPSVDGRPAAQFIGDPPGGGPV